MPAESEIRATISRVHTRVIVVRPPERREVPAEVQFEIAQNVVADATELGTARLRTGPGRG